MPAAIDTSLQSAVEQLAARPERSPAALELLAEVRRGLSAGTLRVASPNATAGDPGAAPAWQVHTWVKIALLLMSRLGALTGTAAAPNSMGGTELDTTPWLKTPPRNSRVPAGSLIREGAHLADGVTCLPPSVLQIGCHVGAGTVVDSMCSIGIGAQVGAGVQLSCGSIVGGALVPLESTPTIVEDGVLMGSASGVFDGAHIGRNAILLAGTQIIPSLGLYDSQQERAMPLDNGVLHVPEDSIVAMGTRPAGRGGIQLQTAVIVGRRHGPTVAEWEMYIDLPHLLRGSVPVRG